MKVFLTLWLMAHMDRLGDYYSMLAEWSYELHQGVDDDHSGFYWADRRFRWQEFWYCSVVAPVLRLMFNINPW